MKNEENEAKRVGPDAIHKVEVIWVYKSDKIIRIVNHNGAKVYRDSATYRVIAGIAKDDPLEILARFVEGQNTIKLSNVGKPFMSDIPIEFPELTPHISASTNDHKNGMAINILLLMVGLMVGFQIGLLLYPFINNLTN
jgi:hypothetical protein